MLMPQRNRAAIYEYLLNEGVLVAIKDTVGKHPDIDVPNLHVLKALQSLKSNGYVTEQFTWRHFYWYLTDQGIVHLRDYLHLPTHVLPATLKPKRSPSQSDRARRRADKMAAVRGCQLSTFEGAPLPVFLSDK